MLRESVDGLAIRPAGVYVDVTFGGGGHSREILSRMDADGRLFGFDQDADAEANIIGDERFTFVRSNFRYLNNWMRYYGVEAIDGLIADLGVSSHHFDDAARGFSFRFDAPLDMRMNKRDGMTAAVKPGMRVVVPFGRSKKYIGVVLRTHGEEPSFDVKDILSLPDPHPIVTGLQLRLWQWIADYYMSPLGDVFKAALPGGLKDEDGYRPKTERCVTLPEKMRSGQSLHVALNMLVQTRARKQRELFECFLAMSRWDEKLLKYGVMFERVHLDDFEEAA